MAILDSGKALETLELLRRGYSAENIACLNKSVAVFANISRVLTDARPVYYLDDAFCTLKLLDDEKKYPAVVNLDLCDTISPKLLSDITDLPKYRGCILCVTVQRARERHELIPIPDFKKIVYTAGCRYSDGSVMSYRDALRLCHLLTAMNYQRCSRIRWGTYNSPSSPMMWVAVQYA